MSSDETTNSEESAVAPHEPPSAGVNPDITGALGIAVGGPVGLALGLKAEHDAVARGRPVGWIPKTAVVLGAISLVAVLIGFILLSSHSTDNPNLPTLNMNATTCGHQPKPTGPGPWYCSTLNGYGTWISFGPTTLPAPN